MKTTSLRLIIAVSAFLVVADNSRFFTEVVKVYPLSPGNVGFLLSLAVVFVTLLVILFTLFNTRWTLKPVLIFALLAAAAISYAANSFHVIIDDSMIRNIVQTDRQETLDLLNLKLLFYLVVFGLLPALPVWRARVAYYPFGKGLLVRSLTLVAGLVVIFLIMLPFGKFYGSFFREHKPLRFQTNPTYAFYSAGLCLTDFFKSRDRPFTPIGLDARRTDDSGSPRLAIVVVGEAARADHFSLNGYRRRTNPLLSNETVINFPNMYSCGTSTAVSVPCMFSLLERSEYRAGRARAMENALDVLARAGVKVLWRDNNSSSKGVADRLPYQNYRSPERNPLCRGECRDPGMLAGLQQFIDGQQGDLLIVLHQMGNHGPAYYKRYPPEFKTFAPVCGDSQLENCSTEEINNAYDNAILYTDYFLDQVIQLLKNNDRRFNTSLIYLSDHGESLGEGGLYLHGLPYLIAPDAQKHVAALMWFGQKAAQEIDTAALAQTAAGQFSHDNLFHTLLGLFKIHTSIYLEEKDILAEARS